MTGQPQGDLAAVDPGDHHGRTLGGVFTPTEAAAVAVGYSVLIGFFVLRTLKLSDLPDMLTRAGMTSAVLCARGDECLAGVADGSIDVYISTSGDAAGLFP